MPSFIATLERIDRETLLANRLDLVLWSLEKTYMRDLEEKGIAIMPTLWVNTPETDSFANFQCKLGTSEIVVKPVVGANGEDVFRVSPNDTPERLGRIAARFRNRDCMIQPFMPNIITEGEYSLLFFAGQYSHAILKKPAESEFRS